MCLSSLGTSEPTVRTPDWSRPMGFYPSLQGLPYPYVCYVCLCVSHFHPGVAPNSMGIADVGPKVLVSSVPLRWRPISVLAPILGGKRQKPYLLEGRGGQVC